MAFKLVRGIAWSAFGAAVTPIVVGLGSASVRTVIAFNPSYEDGVAGVLQGAGKDAAYAGRLTRDTLSAIPNAISCVTTGKLALADKMLRGEVQTKLDCALGIFVEMGRDWEEATEIRFNVSQRSDLDQVNGAFAVVASNDDYDGQIVQLESVKIDGEEIPLEALANYNISDRAFG